MSLDKNVPRSLDDSTDGDYESLSTSEADIGKLLSALDADGHDINNASSVSTDGAVTITDDNTIAYGRDHGATTDGKNVVIGVGARALEDVNQTVSGNDPRKVAVGFEAAKNDEQFGVTAVGYKAASDNSGKRVTALGNQAAQYNTGDQTTALGYEAAEFNTGYRSMVVGYEAAWDNTGGNITALGYEAARDNTGNGVTAVGYKVARDNTGNNVTTLGYSAARGDGLSDPSTMGDDNIGIGHSAIRNNQASGLIAIGQDAGINAQTDDQLIITQRDGTRRMVMDLTTGDLKITGSLTENASL